MVRIRQGWLVAVLGLGLGLVTACKKDEKKSEPAGDKSPAAAGDDLSLIPVDSDIVLGINFAQIQQSAMWKQFVEPKLATGEAATKVKEFKDKCGFDPTTSVKTISVGVKLVGDKPDGVVVVHGADKAKTLACLDHMKDDMAKEGTEFTRDGDVVLLKETKNGSSFAMTFLDDTTALGVFGSNANAAGVKAAAAGGSTLKSSPQFVDMYGKINTHDSLWGFANGNSKPFEKMGALGVKPSAVYGSVNVTDGLALDVRLRLATPDAATQLAKMGKAQLDQLGKMFDKADATSEGSDVKFAIMLSSQKLQALLTQFGGMFGGLGGP